MSISRRLFGKVAAGGVVAGPAIADVAMKSESYEWKRLSMQQLMQNKMRDMEKGTEQGLNRVLYGDDTEADGYSLEDIIMRNIPRDKLYRFALKHGLVTEEEIMQVLRNDLFVSDNKIATPYKSFAEHTKMRLHNDRVLRDRVQQMLSPHEKKINNLYDLTVELAKRAVARGFGLDMFTDA